ncbi:MAG: hypothetical protein AB7W16_00285 [Candidatus Obscuribacterales bacterium]
MQIQLSQRYYNFLIELIKQALLVEFFSSVLVYTRSLAAYNDAERRVCQEVGYSPDDLTYLEFELDEVKDAEELEKLQEAQTVYSTAVRVPLATMSSSFELARQSFHDGLSQCLTGRGLRFCRTLLNNAHLLVEAPGQTRSLLVLKLALLKPARF